MDNISSSKLWECPWPGILGTNDISLEEHSSPWLLEIMLNLKHIKRKEIKTYNFIQIVHEQRLTWR